VPYAGVPARMMSKVVPALMVLALLLPTTANETWESDSQYDSAQRLVETKVPPAANGRPFTLPDIIPAIVTSDSAVIGLDVNVNGRAERVVLKAGQDPLLVSSSFCSRHGLEDCTFVQDALISGTPYHSTVDPTNQTDQWDRTRLVLALGRAASSPTAYLEIGCDHEQTFKPAKAVFDVRCRVGLVVPLVVHASSTRSFHPRA
jgi:hypothetical protein